MRPLQIEIPENESLLDLLDLVSTSDKYKERVQQLIDLQAQINKDIGDRERIGKLEDLINLAASDRAAAEELRAQGESYYSKKKLEADDYVAGGQKLVALERDVLEAEKRDLADKLALLDRTAAELGAQEKDIKAREDAVAIRENGAAQREQAVAVKEEKLAAKAKRVQEAAAE
jgi:hypothetical protein